MRSLQKRGVPYRIQWRAGTNKCVPYRIQWRAGTNKCVPYKKIMKTIAGLGNPGLEYQNTKHNIGFMILDSFAQKRKLSFTKDGNALIAKRSSFIVLKPITYMNLSGKAIDRFVEDIENLIVICDDIYLPFGEIRIRQSGGDGGHNGLLSIIDQLQTTEFTRMRIGIGQPENSSMLPNFVLGDFTNSELEMLKTTIDFAIKLIDCFISNGYQSMINFYSKNKKSYSEKLSS